MDFYFDDGVRGLWVLRVLRVNEGTEWDKGVLKRVVEGSRR